LQPVEVDFSTVFKRFRLRYSQQKMEAIPDLLLENAFNNAAASDKSLGIMLTFAAIGTPMVIGYTTFVYLTFRGKVKIDEMSY